MTIAYATPVPARSHVAWANVGVDVDGWAVESSTSPELRMGNDESAQTPLVPRSVG